MYCLTADGWFLAEGRWPPLAGEGLSSHQLGFSSRSASRTPILTQRFFGAPTAAPKWWGFVQKACS